MDDSKNTMVVVIIVILLAVGGFFLIRQSVQKQEAPIKPITTEAPAQEPTASATPETAIESLTVKYSDTGFVPETITVMVGDRVTWINESSNDMWVASGPHPQHTALPGFDQMQNAPKGGTYMYTFDKVGEWKYHNHLNPTATGMVVVSEAETPSGTETSGISQ